MNYFYFGILFVAMTLFVFIIEFVEKVPTWNPALMRGILISSIFLAIASFYKHYLDKKNGKIKK